MTVSYQRRQSDWAIAFAVVGGSAALGYFVMQFARPIIHDRYFPWIVARSSGIGAYVAITALVALGIWFRHPWRARFMRPHVEAQLRAHAALAAGCLLLLVAHILSLVLDRYAGVGWIGAVAPGKSTYRPNAVALGVIACYLVVLIAATARLGGRLIGRQWLTVHRIAVPVWALVWLHGVLAGADTARLRSFYAATGIFVVGMVVTRVFGKPATGRLAVR